MNLKAFSFPKEVADEMIRAILDGRKSVTRRVVKFPEGQTGRLPSDGARDHLFYPGGIKYPPYRTGDTLYVRETWSEYNGVYIYKTHCRNKKVLEEVGNVKIFWRPSIHMPKEAARLFLRVTNVRVERLQDITIKDAIKEGCSGVPCDCMNKFVDGGTMCCVDCMNTGWQEPPTVEFMELWNSTIKKADLSRYGWEANPWVWVILFERISKEEAQS